MKYNEKLNNSDLIIQNFNMVGENLNNLMKECDPLMKKLNEIAKTFTPYIIEASEAINNFNKSVNESHIKDLVFISPFFKQMSVIKAREIFITQKKSAIQFYDDFLSKKENTLAIFESWRHNPYFTTERCEILKDALEAHVAKKYTLSIPVLMNQIEGLIQDIFKISHKNIGTSLKSAFPQDQNTLFYLSSSYIVRSILNSEVFNSNKNEGYSSNGIYPQRGDLQHGNDTNYYKNEYASARLILLMDFISSEDFLNAANEYKVKKNK